MIKKDSLDPLDDAIDRTVRDMTHVAADDRAVARVMARVGGADARDMDARDVNARDASAAAGWGWMLTPRVAFCGVLALLLMALITRPLWHSLRNHVEGQRAAVTAPQPSSQQQQRQQQHQPPPPLAAREFPTRVADASSTTQARAAARMARREALMPASAATDAGDASEQRARQELTPLESDMQIASITPAPLADAPAIQVEPLSTSSLQVDEISVPSIDMPPVSPERRE